MANDRRVLTYRELLALSDEERYALDVYHRWDDAANRRKLAGLYGRLAARQDADIIAAIRGRRVLDVGAGYGFFAHRLAERGFDVTALEPNQDLIALAKAWYGLDLVRGDIHDLDFPPEHFDSVIFREAVEHLDCARAFEQADRVARQAIIVFQTHLSPAVELCRRLSGHEELRPERLDYYEGLLRRLGYTRLTVTFRDVFALPLSGGTLTRSLVPGWPGLERAVIALDDAANRALRACRLQRLFCWRFLLVAEKTRAAR
jgi:SAM-dependent methyltransferase